MASYHSSFTYKRINSASDQGLMIVSFEPDNGFMDSFLSMENISDDYYDMTKRFDYGSKYSTSAEIQITAIKKDGSDMSVNEFRSYARWLTGARANSWLDMYSGETIVYSFLGKFLNLEQYKLDGRTVGIRATFSSVSPWAFSEPKSFECDIWQLLDVDSDGYLWKSGDDSVSLGYSNGILSPNHFDADSYFNVDSDGVAYLDNSYHTNINNQSDDEYIYTYLDIEYDNENSTFLSIKNETLNEESLVKDIKRNETISISAKQFIASYTRDEITGDLRNNNRIFGDSFNFVWPRLKPGMNKFVVEGDSRGSARFTYRYPMKIGDCTMDID